MLLSLLIKFVKLTGQIIRCAIRKTGQAVLPVRTIGRRGADSVDWERFQKELNLTFLYFQQSVLY